MIRLLRREPVPDETTIDADGTLVAVAVRQMPRARHYRLTIDARRGPVLTVPGGGNWGEAEAFLRKHRAWLAARLNRQAPPVALADGAVIPLRGVPHAIVATGRLRGQVAIGGTDANPVLEVPGDAEHLPRRLVDWLKAAARSDLSEAVERHARALAVKPAGLSIRDQSSRWGSCSSAGRLNFNWRLILAPGFVLDYVAAHEVAHLVEMNHSPAFWRTVERTLPEMARGRAWLKANGRELHRYGA